MSSVIKLNLSKSGTTECIISFDAPLPASSNRARELCPQSINGREDATLRPPAYRYNVGTLNKNSSAQYETIRYDPEWEEDSTTTSREKLDSRQLSYQSNLSKKTLPLGTSSFNRKTSYLSVRCMDFSYEPPISEIIMIANNRSVNTWVAETDGYKVAVASARKTAKLWGFKQYVTYELKPTFNNMSVYRRYKHFVWLRNRLVLKFCLIAIPPLPGKEVPGRYEEEFVQHRRIQLQDFVDWVCRHPVLSKCEVWHHFLTCPDGLMWKEGKRKAEEDPFVGLNFCLAILPPPKSLSKTTVESEIDSFSQFINNMLCAIKNVREVANFERDRLKNRQTEYQRIGTYLIQLGKALGMDEKRESSINDASLSGKVSLIGDIYKRIGKISTDQPKFDWIPFADRVKILRGILNSFQGIISTHRNAMRTLQDWERKLSPEQLLEMNRRTDVISYAVMAERTHFKMERDCYLKETLMSLIDEQIKFHSNVALELQRAQRLFGSGSKNQ